VKKLALIVASVSMASAVCFNASVLAATKTNNHSGEALALNSAQTKEIQQVVHDYLVNNPEVLVEASQALQRKEEMKMQSTARNAISQNAKNLFNDPGSPVIGNPNGATTIVEFMDYQCGHCKEMTPVMESLVKQNPGLRIVLKELPIFGETSDFAAKAALAAQKQGKFAAFHQALMKSSGALSHDSVMQIAKSVGLNTEQLKQDMDDNTYSQQLKDNMQLAQALGLMGTPAFIIGNPNGKNAFVPGATSAENMQQLINQVGGK
jgi:protein-disulfide isomerase